LEAGIMRAMRRGNNVDVGLLRQLGSMRKDSRRGDDRERSRGRYGKVNSQEVAEEAAALAAQELSFKDIVFILSPFFWPNNIKSRIRSSCTWLCVILSKVCTLMAPLYLSEATDYVVLNDTPKAFENLIIFCALRFAGGLFREGQGLIFLKVRQQAYMQLAVQAFTHVHSLSINWHISKKTGNVMRNMDRGTEASTTLVSLIFLYLGPTVIEAIAVVGIFLFHFQIWSLALVVFICLMIFITVTIIISTWRKKIREENNSNDNDFHEKATESLINFETVKYFNAEKYEIDRFSEAVTAYQIGAVKLSLGQSATSVTQDFLINLTICLSLFISAVEVTKGNMQLGNFVAVITYITFMFSPLAFIGALYNGISQGIVDVKGNDKCARRIYPSWYYSDLCFQDYWR
jgi:ABC-type multidrug transport system fused ATPase/permease subunit